MNLLPQVSPEDLNEGDLQRGDFAVHKDPSQVKLHLETDIHLEHKRIQFQTSQEDSNSFSLFPKVN